LNISFSVLSRTISLLYIAKIITGIIDINKKAISSWTLKLYRSDLSWDNKKTINRITIKTE
jgi:hypothetical protein